MKSDQLEYLKSHQQEVGLKLLRHARWLAATKYGWNGGTKSLPLGKDPEDIVCAVVDDYLNDVRHFNPRHGIEVQLKRALSSKLWALHRRVEAHAVPLEPESDDCAPREYAADGLGVDETVMMEHDWKVLFELFREEPDVKGDEELELVLMAIEDGAEKAPDIADQTGMSVERIYELKKKLRKAAPKVMAKFHKGAETLP
ncbi:MAG: hypothetical protein PCFJNLEI_01109 [Verrucomicrobiae bacterium]|nr:hypothetical protein [Verrucomicrobiae bacterium]